jgi:hypothetical protein
MSLTISTLARRTIPAVLVAATAMDPAVAGAIPNGTSGETAVSMASAMRACDFSPIRGGAAQSDATVSAVVRKTGGTVVAEVHLSQPTSPGTHYDIMLIQAPRAASSPCTSPGPGVAVGGLDGDGAGQATAIVQDSIRPGTTGVWLFVQRPSPYSQNPVEYYTSDIIAPV